MMKQKLIALSAMGAMTCSLIPGVSAKTTIESSVQSRVELRAQLRKNHTVKRVTKAKKVITSAKPSCDHLTGISFAACSRGQSVVRRLRSASDISIRSSIQRGMTIKTGTGASSGSGFVRGFYDQYDWMTPVEDTMDSTPIEIDQFISGQKPVTHDDAALTNAAWEFCQDRVPRSRIACIDLYKQEYADATIAPSDENSSTNQTIDQGTQMNPGGMGA